MMCRLTPHALEHLLIYETSPAITSFYRACWLHCWRSLCPPSTMRGLTNYGTYCSINSVVQCLYETRELRGLIQQVDEQDYQAHNTVAARLKPLTYEMARSDNQLPCDPSFLVDSMSAYSNVSFDVQEDSDLVFKCIINTLADGSPSVYTQ